MSIQTFTPTNNYQFNAQGVADVASGSIGIIFNRALFVASNNADVFSKFEGPDMPLSGAQRLGNPTGSTEMGYPVVRATDLTKGRGKSVVFTVLAQLGGFGKVGEQRLRGYEEKPRTGTYSVVVDLVRHATAYTEVVEQFMAAGASYEEACAMLLGDWFGRKKQDHALWILKNRATARNTLFAGQKTSVDQLLSADLVSTTMLTEAASILKALGGKATKLRKTKVGAVVQKFMFFGTENTFKALKSNSLYVYALAEGGKLIGSDDEGNPLWDGGYATWDGHGVFHWDVQDPDAISAEGCMIEPRAHLGDPIAGDDTAVVLNFGGQANPDNQTPFTQYFPGYNYLLYQAQAALVDTATYYLIVYNQTDSPTAIGASTTDSGKWGFYSYVAAGNNGNAITITKRLAAAGGTYKVTTLGSVTYDANVHTVNHPTGAPVALANAKGVPYAYFFCLGANALLRAYGALPVEGKRVTGEDDYGLDQGMAVKSIFGTDVSRDTLGQPRNYVLCVAAIQPQGMKLPVVSS